ncbi:hypothetical protein ACNZ3Z_08870 [Enterobacter kobei]|uniref:hypothetical protein n=1 Tax=Enterobacter kobei TaxID=208224 RepID=UPI003B91462E
MSTITKERVANLLQFNSEGSDCQANAEQWEVHELARMALASLEAEAVCVIDQSNLDYLKSGADADVWPASRKEMGDVLLYRTAPPAPANAEPVVWLWSHRKHPSEVSLVRPEDDEKAEGAHWSGWSCQALYAEPPAPVSVPAAMEMDDDFDSAFEHGKAVGWNAYRAAMLQGAEPVSQPYTLPEVIDENLVEGLRLLQCMLDDYRERNYGHAHEWIRHIDRKFAEHSESHEDDAYSIFSSLLQGVENAETPTTMQTAPALDSSPKIAELPSGNSPVIPDGWVLVPEEPTHEMLEAGDEQFGTYDVYRRMIAASPQQEVKS